MFFDVDSPRRNTIGTGKDWGCAAFLVCGFDRRWTPGLSAVHGSAPGTPLLGWPGRAGRVAERQDAASCGLNRLGHSQPRCGITALESRWRRGNARVPACHKERHLVPVAPARQRRTGHPVRSGTTLGMVRTFMCGWRSHGKLLLWCPPGRCFRLGCGRHQ